MGSFALMSLSSLRSGKNLKKKKPCYRAVLKRSETSYATIDWDNGPGGQGVHKSCKLTLWNAKYTGTCQDKAGKTSRRGMPRISVFVRVSASPFCCCRSTMLQRQTIVRFKIHVVDLPEKVFVHESKYSGSKWNCSR